MNLWLAHFGALFIGSGILWIGATTVARWEPPIWAFPLWIVGSVAVSFPLHRVLKRSQLQSLCRTLETEHPGSNAVAVAISFSQWIELVAPTVPPPAAGLTERYRRGAVLARSRDHLVAMITEPTLQFWSGPPGQPQFLSEVPWADVDIDAVSGRVSLRRDGSKPLTLRLLRLPRPPALPEAQPLERAAELARLMRSRSEGYPPTDN